MMNNENDSSGDELFGGNAKTATTTVAPSTGAGVTESSGYATDNVHRSIFYTQYVNKGQIPCLRNFLGHFPKVKLGTAPRQEDQASLSAGVTWQGNEGYINVVIFGKKISRNFCSIC